jgi:Family of unknown function (DUF6011)
MSNAESPAAEPVKCSRCNRVLRAAASIAAKVGPRCAAIEAVTEGLSAKQVDKLMQVITDKGVKAANRKGIYFVANEADGVIRICHVNGNCTCEWGRRRKSALAKVCYHVAAARLAHTPRTRFAKAA